MLLVIDSVNYAANNLLAKLQVEGFSTPRLASGIGLWLHGCFTTVTWLMAGATSVAVIDPDGKYYQTVKLSEI